MAKPSEKGREAFNPTNGRCLYERLHRRDWRKLPSELKAMYYKLAAEIKAHTDADAYARGVEDAAKADCDGCRDGVVWHPPTTHDNGTVFPSTHLAPDGHPYYCKADGARRLLPDATHEHDGEAGVGMTTRASEDSIPAMPFVPRAGTSDQRASQPSPTKPRSMGKPIPKDALKRVMDAVMPSLLADAAEREGDDDRAAVCGTCFGCREVCGACGASAMTVCCINVCPTRRKPCPDCTDSERSEK